MDDIKISRGYDMCHGCSKRQSRNKITARYSGKELELCEDCCTKLKEKLQ